MQIDNQIASHRWRLRRANSNHIPDGTAEAPGLCLPSIRSRVHEYAMRRIRSLGCRARRKQPRHHIAAKQREAALKQTPLSPSPNPSHTL